MRHRLFEVGSLQWLCEAVGFIELTGHALRGNYPFFGEFPGIMVSDANMLISLMINWVENQSNNARRVTEDRNRKVRLGWLGIDFQEQLSQSLGFFGTES